MHDTADLLDVAPIHGKFSKPANSHETFASQTNFTPPEEFLMTKQYRSRSKTSAIAGKGGNSATSNFDPFLGTVNLQ